VKARSALEGRSVRDVTVLLFERWLDESPGLNDALADAGRPSAGASWLKRWEAIGARIDDAASDDRTTREILIADRT
jgi:hypothetical protein